MAVRNEAIASSSPASAPPSDPNGGNGLAADGDGLGTSGNGLVAGVDGLDAATSANGHTAADEALSSPALYLNRELTWLAFNQRVLAEAEDEANPILERVKFLAIGCATIDEFFMKRIGGLKQQVVAGLHELTPDGRTPQQQIAACYEQLREIEARQRKLLPVLVEGLAERNIFIDSYQSLKPEQQKELRDYYIKNVFPLVTPQALDPAHPFPFVSNLSLNLLVTVRNPIDSETMMARVKVPLGHGISRFMRVGSENRFVPLEDVMDDNLDLLFPGMEVTSCEFFRVTRNANTERDEEEADDLLALIESELRDRRFSPIVRMEVPKGVDAPIAACSRRNSASMNAKTCSRPTA
jgi:polyphosphate kinase